MKKFSELDAFRDLDAAKFTGDSDDNVSVRTVNDVLSKAATVDGAGNVEIRVISRTQSETVLSVYGRVGDVIAENGDYTKAQVGLSEVENVDTTTTENINDSINKRFITDAEKEVLGNTSGSNTGDQDLSGLELKSNKSTDVNLGDSDILYPTQKAVKEYVANNSSGGYRDIDNIVRVDGLIQEIFYSDGSKATINRASDKYISSTVDTKLGATTLTRNSDNEIVATERVK